MLQCFIKCLLLLIKIRTESRTRTVVERVYHTLYIFGRQKVKVGFSYSFGRGVGVGFPRLVTGSPRKKYGQYFCTILHHIGSHVSFINPRRPTRSPLWFSVWRISSYTVQYGFLYGPTRRKFLPMPTHMGSCTGSYCFLCIYMDSHAIPC